MRIVECCQGDPVWVQSRLGIPTASNFHRIMTPKTMKVSSQADRYCAELIAEWMLGVPMDQEHSQLMERGKELEEKAALFYAMQTNTILNTIGFCLLDLPKLGEIGCSPDRLVGSEGLLEIKCPAPVTHIDYLLNGVGADYRCQVQGQLWITGREWLDFLSYHPTMPEYQIRVQRDEDFIGKLCEATEAFLNQLERGKQRMIELGAVPESVAA